MCDCPAPLGRVNEGATSGQTEMTPPQIAFAHVGKSFDGGHGAERVLAVDDVSLDVCPGERVALIGPSGAGKTTLLRLINGSVRPTGGHVTVSAGR